MEKEAISKKTYKELKENIKDRLYEEGIEYDEKTIDILTHIVEQTLYWKVAELTK